LEKMAVSSRVPWSAIRKSGSLVASSNTGCAKVQGQPVKSRGTMTRLLTETKASVSGSACFHDNGQLGGGKSDEKK